MQIEQKTIYNQNNTRSLEKALVNGYKLHLLNNKVTKRKKTEHTIISNNLRNSEHQNIHVMLSYANITPRNKKKNKNELLN